MGRPVIIRQAVRRDYNAYTRLFRELGVDDGCPPLGPWIEEILPTTWVAEIDGEVVGYAYFQCLETIGYLRNIVTDPGRRRAGIGKALMARVARSLTEGGLDDWCLNVRPENDAAVAMYRKFGLAPAHRAQALRFDWSIVERLPAHSTGRVLVIPVYPGQEAEVEAKTKLHPGQIVDARRRNRVILQLRKENQVLGVALFEPTFPGAHPFRLSDPSLIRPFLQGLRSHALSDQPLMNVVIEDNEALFELLVAHGAVLRLDILNMRGRLVDVPSDLRTFDVRASAPLPSPHA